MLKFSFSLLIIAFLFLVGCNPLGGGRQGSRVDDDYLPGYGVGVADHLELVSGDNQSGGSGDQLSSPLVVRVKDTTDAAVAGILLNVQVMSGGGSVDALTVITDVTGKASVQWTLGTPLGSQSVKIYSESGLVGNPKEIIFTATSLLSPPSIANSSISGTTPVVANGTSSSVITIELRDTNNDPIVGTVPTFGSSGSNNTYGVCSSTNTSGISTCTLKSITAETKTIQLTSPVVKTGNSVTFVSDSAVIANSSISGTTPVVADGTSTSTITITLKDTNNNPISGTVPTFNASGTSNTYGTCSSTNTSGVSTCTFNSTKAEVKAIQLTSPVVKVGNNITFTADSAVIANSSISGSSPVVADGINISTISITLLDANNNPVVGIVPTFNASGTNNTYGTCSVTSALGISTCTLSSTKAETKTVAITSPISKIGNSIAFTADSASIANSSISGTTSVVADGISTSVVTITLNDVNSNPIVGTVPTFSATGTNNTYGACSSSDASGVSTCTLSSTKAEAKTISLTSPISKSGNSVTFIPDSAVIANSSISGTTPVVADGTSTSTITITLKDANNNAVIGEIPTFNASGTSNAYGTCSSTNTSGVSTCTMSSTKAEVKAIQLTSPVVKLGNNVTFNAGSAVIANSSISGTTSVVADGMSVSTVTITLIDTNNNPVVGTVPTFSASGTNNTYGTCSSTDSSGVSTCTLSSTKAEAKTISLTSPISKSGNSVTFTAGSAVIANSSISGSSPVVADGTSTSTITITLKDTNNNPISGTVPTFNASGTNNTYGTCSSTDASGESTCAMSSTKAEVKAIQLTSPVVKVGNNITFTADSAVIANSSISGTTPVVADGTSASTVTITLIDTNNNPVIGTIPTFSASGTNNTYGTCSSSDSSGTSTCTLKSTTAETKVVSLVSPIAKTGNSVVFTVGAPASITLIQGSGQSASRGTTLSTDFAVEVKDAQGRAVSGVTVNWSVTAGNGSVSSSSTTTNASGVASSTLTLGTTPGTNTVTASITSPSLSTTVSATGTTSALTNNTWNFNLSEALNLDLSSSALENATAATRLKLSEQTDQDNSAIGFGGGSTGGALAWDITNLKLALDSSASCVSSNSCSELSSAWTPQWNSLISYWKLNGASGSTAVVDSKGSNSGTASNVTFGASGKLGTSGSFNGSSSYIDFGAPTDMNVGLQNWSVQAWIKTTSTASVSSIIAKSLLGPQIGRWALLLGDTCGVGKVEFIFHLSSGSTNFCGSSAINDGLWHHILVSVNRSGNLVIYVDGVAQTTANISASSSVNMVTSNYLFIGVYNTNTGLAPGTFNFNGNIDEVAVWNTNLSASEAQAIYQRQSSKYSGHFLSRIIDGFKLNSNWTKFNWKTSLPFYKSLPITNELKTNYSGLVNSSGVSNDSNLSTGLVSLWRLDEASGTTGTGSVKDATTNAINGTPTSVTFGQNGRLGSSGNFNGTSSQISFGSINNFDFGTATSFTASAWVKFTSTASMRIVGNGAGSTTYTGWVLFVGAGKAYFAISGTTAATSTSVQTSNTFSDGNWHHIVGRADQTAKTMQLYVDGVAQNITVDSNQCSTTIDSQTISYNGCGNNADHSGVRLSTIGSYNGTASFFSGNIDEVGIWNRALNAAEIKMLYRRGANRVSFQVRSCSTANCSDDSTGANWKGINGTTASYFSELYNTSDGSLTGVPKTTSPEVSLSAISTKQYFQYRAILESDDLSTSPDLQFVQVDPTHYSDQNPYVITKVGIDYYSLSSAVQSLGTNSCTSGVKYNLGKGTTYANAVWHYWTGTVWDDSTGSGTANTEAQLNATGVLAAFGTKYGEGKVFLKAYLPSDGTSPCELKSFQLNGQY